MIRTMHCTIALVALIRLSNFLMSSTDRASFAAWAALLITAWTEKKIFLLPGGNFFGRRDGPGSVCAPFQTH